MDQLIPILIAAVVFGFQAYANYKKEQEKAQKRNFGKPVDQAPDEYPGEFGEYDDDFPLPREVREEIAREQVTQEKVVRERVRREIPLEPAAANPYSRYQGTVDLSRKRRPESHKKLPIADVKLTDLDELPDTAPATFNLRQAVIHSIILDRPYKD